MKLGTDKEENIDMCDDNNISKKVIQKHRIEQII